jgi:hypothetical protein
MFWTGLRSLIAEENLSLSCRARPNKGAAHENLPLVNGHNIYAYCNGRPLGTIYILLIAKSQVQYYSLWKHLLHTLTDLSVGAPTGTQPPPIHQNGAEQSQRTRPRSTLITGTISLYPKLQSFQNISIFKYWLDYSFSLHIFTHLWNCFPRFIKSFSFASIILIYLKMII